MTHFMKVYFHTCQYLFTAYFRKMLSFEMHFIKLSVSACFPTIIKKHPEKTELLFCFWFRDSRVIIVDVLPSLESVCKHKFISRHITIMYTRSAVCTT